MKYDVGIKILRYNERTKKWYKDNNKNMTVYLLNENGCGICGERFFYCSGNDGRFCSLSCNTKYRNSVYGISPETAKKIGDGNRGKKRTSEQKQKMMGRPQVFNPMSIPEFVEKRRQTVIKNGSYKGNKNPNWKGGCIKHNGYIWLFNKDLKEKIKKRDNFQCQNPLCKHEYIIGNLQVHHIDYDKMNNEETNLITLCRSCNMKANTKRDYYTNLYDNIIMTKYIKE